MVQAHQSVARYEARLKSMLDDAKSMIYENMAESMFHDDDDDDNVISRESQIAVIDTSIEVLVELNDGLNEQIKQGRPSREGGPPYRYDWSQIVAGPP